MNNTVGSLELANVVRARKNLSLVMTDFQKAVLIGCILGDAYITKLGKIRFEQSVKNKEYAFWVYGVLSSLLYPAKPRTLSRFSKKQNAYYDSVRFSSRQYFRSWQSFFYPEGKKIFSENIPLTPVTLAVWYMDDGCWTGSKAIIAIEGFDDVSQQKIKEALERQFGIEVKIGKNRKLLIRKRSHDRFFNLVAPYIIPSMQYKIPKPRND